MPQRPRFFRHQPLQRKVGGRLDPRRLSDRMSENLERMQEQQEASGGEEAETVQEGRMFGESGDSPLRQGYHRREF